MSHLYDITEVCAALNTTSRTLRYYESHGLITSTTNYPSRRRHYTEAQVYHIQKVLSLRTLGLPLKTIRELLQNDISLQEAILTHRADILRRIAEKHREINLLEEVLHSLETGQTETTLAPDLYCSERQMEIAHACTEALLSEDYAACLPYFSQDMKLLLPLEALRRSWEIIREPAGAYCHLGPLVRLDPPNMLLQYLHYKKQTLRIRYVFHREEICGLWTDYAPEDDAPESP